MSRPTEHQSSAGDDRGHAQIGGRDGRWAVTAGGGALSGGQVRLVRRSAQRGWRRVNRSADAARAEILYHARRFVTSRNAAGTAMLRSAATHTIERLGG